MVQAMYARTASPSDRTDEPGATVAPLLPPVQPHPRGGRPRAVDRRAVLKTLGSLTWSGCPRETCCRLHGDPRALSLTPWGHHAWHERKHTA